MKYAIALGMLLILILGSCATIFKGTNQEINIKSTPEKARIVVTANTGMVVFDGETPAKLTLSKSNTYSIKITLPGYSEQTLHIGHSFETTFLCNLLCGGLVGMIVDAVSGAMWNLEPGEFNISLRTAMHNGQEEVFLVLYLMDDAGQLKTATIPLIKA